tara:strand:- start:2476 stop:3420 length:945 start_codon:yes stop_codon:yes gene_type:complete
MSEIKYIDLFAGTGGFSLAFNSIKNSKCVFSNDMEKNSKTIYDLNNTHTLTLKNLNEINVDDIPDHDVLCGGFPCQPFSIAGKQKGFDDKRSNVFWKILEIIKSKNPKILILENVKNLKSHDKGKTYKIIEKNLSDLGYKIKFAILDTCKITKIPQHRERIYIICFKDQKDYNRFDFDFKEQVNNKISVYLETDIPTKYYYTDKLKVYDRVKENVTKHISENVLYQYRRHYVRENKSNCCPTLTANMGGGGHNVPLLLDDTGIRKLTPRECFNLQGYPTSYKLPPKMSDTALYKLVGNAVTVKVVELVLKKLFT